MPVALRDTFLSRQFESRSRELDTYKAQAANALGPGIGGPGAMIAASLGLSSMLGFSDEAARHDDQYRRFRGWAYVAINRIATRMAALPLRIGRKLKGMPALAEKLGWRRRTKLLTPWQKMRGPAYVKEMDQEVELIEDHELLTAIRAPNEAMVTWGLFYSTAASMEITGKGCWWMPRVKGAMQVWPLPSSWVTPVHTRKKLFDHFRIQPMSGLSTGWYDVPPEEVAVFCLPDPADPLGYCSPVQSQSAAVAADEAIQAAQWRQFKNSFFPNVALRVGRLPGMLPGTEGERPVLEADQRRELIEAARAIWEGVVNYNEPLIVDGMIEGVDRLSLGPQEMDYLNSGTAVKSRIFQALGCNPVIAGEITGVNRAQAAVADQIFVSNVVNPLATLFGQVMTEHYAREDEDIVIWLEEAETKDPDYELKKWQAAGTLQVVTKDEYREKFMLMPPLDEGGDEFPGPAKPEPPQGGPFGQPQPFGQEKPPTDEANQDEEQV